MNRILFKKHNNRRMLRFINLIEIALYIRDWNVHVNYLFSVIDKELVVNCSC